MRRLALIGGEDLTERLRLSRDHQRALATLRDGIESMAPALELGYRIGAKANDVILLRAAIMGMPPDAGWQADIAKGQAAQFPVKPADLMPDVTGAALGAKLKKLEARWIASGMTLGKAELLS